jgi:hypothetical protein
MGNLNAAPAIEQSEPLHGAPVSQAEPAAAISVAPVASTDENAQAEAAAELPQSDASAPAKPSLIQQMSERLAGAEAQPFDPSPVIAFAPDTGDPHEHELARMVDEGGPCPEKFSKEVLGTFAIGIAMADHPFQSFPTPEDPVAQRCHVEGCQFSDIGHPDTDVQVLIREVIPSTSGKVNEQITRFAPGKIIPVEIADDLLKPSLEDRVAKLEADVAQLRKITEHHGLRGPQV